MPSLVAATLLLFIASASARSRESFDFGWRYILGDQGFKPHVSAPPSAAPTSGFCSFDKNISGTQCYNLSPLDAASMDECAAACCVDYSCGLWQWQDPATNPTGGGGCWSGPGDCSSNVSNPLWTSFVRTAPPPGPPHPSGAPCTDASQPCAAGFDDSAWRVVNTPHDFIVEGVPASTCDRGHGYLCFNKSWYRKTFTVNASAEGQLAWLDFDGVYKNSDMWLNGAYLGHFTSGYVSFQYWLHNVTLPNSTTPVLSFGSPSLLSVLVDAETEQEGWFYEGGGINVRGCCALFLLQTAPFFQPLTPLPHPPRLLSMPLLRRGTCG